MIRDIFQLRFDILPLLQLGVQLGHMGEFRMVLPVDPHDYGQNFIQFLDDFSVHCFSSFI